MKHEIEIIADYSKIWRYAFSGRPARIVRWKCSCGKSGSEHTTKHEPERARQKAVRGGQQHLRSARRRRK